MFIECKIYNFIYTYSYFSEPLDTVVPTVGFSSVSLTHRGHCVVIYDLGGGPQIRGIWHRYYVDVRISVCVEVMNEVEFLGCLFILFM
jgi:ADP-ribosylation factor-like protein 13B